MAQDERRGRAVKRRRLLADDAAAGESGVVRCKVKHEADSFRDVAHHTNDDARGFCPSMQQLKGSEQRTERVTAAAAVAAVGAGAGAAAAEGTEQASDSPCRYVSTSES